MKITVIGKRHMEGTSRRTGQPYNFDEVHFNGPAWGVEGMAAQVVKLNPGLCPFADILIGREYELDFDQRGFCVSFQPVSKG